MNLFIITFIKLCLFCFGFKIELACAENIQEESPITGNFPVLDINVSEIKEAYSWIQSPYSLSPRQQDYCAEALRLTKILGEKIIKPYREMTDESNAPNLMGLCNFIKVFKTVKDSPIASPLYPVPNQIYILLEEISEWLKYKVKLIPDISIPVGHPESQALLELSDNCNLLIETITFIKDEVMETLPESVRKLFSNTYRDEYVQALINTFIYKGKEFPGERLRRKADKMIEGTKAWTKENSTKHSPLNFCRTIVNFAIPQGFIADDSTQSKVAIWSDDEKKPTTRASSKKTSSSKENKKKKRKGKTPPSSSAAHNNEDKKEAKEQSVPATLEVVNNELKPAISHVLPVDAHTENAIAANESTDDKKEMSSSEAELMDTTQPATASFAGGGFEDKSEFKDPIIPTYDQWFNRQDQKKTIDILEDGTINCDWCARFIQGLVQKQKDSGYTEAKFIAKGGSHRFAVLISPTTGKPVYFPFAQHSGREMDRHSRSMLKDGFKLLFNIPPAVLILGKNG